MKGGDCLRANALLAAATLHVFARDRCDTRATAIYMRAATHVAPWLDLKVENLRRTAGALSPLSTQKTNPTNERSKVSGSPAFTSRC